IYLVLATGMVAIIPASFLTFTSTPVYATYELAPRIGSLTALEDQQIAGIVMKIGTIPVTWTTMAVLWFRHAKQEASIP
ncbi:MAG: cytochrome c oxidase assembly protein, partial [Acidimicrobiia bacterium]